MQNGLADKRQVVLILRLTLDGRGQLIYGEVVDLESKQLGRFMDLKNLTRVVQAWLATQQQDNTLNSSP